MNGFDRGILLWMNGLAGRCRPFDAAVTELARSNLAKGVPLAAVLLVFWFAAAPEAERRRRRELVVATFAAAAAAIVLGRLLAHALPFRVRPVHDPTLGFVPPYGGAERMLRGWSAFPSDHAMLFGAMATGILLLSRRVGIAALAYTAVFILLPRVYLGWHHPTDVLAGLALGVGLAAVAGRPRIRAGVARVPLAALDRRPGAFYAAAFVALLEVTTLFGDVRQVLQGPLVAELRGRPFPAAGAPPAAAHAARAAREADRGKPLATASR